MDIKIQLPQHVGYIIETLQTAGYEAYAVGGCVRDTILGRTPDDWDITTSANPQQIKELFGYTIDTGIQHGTVTVMLDRIGYEVTTYRIDGLYEDGRHPKEVSFTQSLEEDLRRRDFTINAMAYNDTTGLVDLYGGVDDLNHGIIRCVGDARERFGEDALRMLRAVRFAAQLGFAIAEDTMSAIKDLSPTLHKISAERIQAELVKLLCSGHPEKFLLVYETGMTAIFMPEFDIMMQTKQNHPRHIYNVGMHTIKTLEAVKNDRVLRITMLLHDVAKPKCRTTDEHGINHFKGHPVLGAEMAKDILKRLKFDNDTIDAVTRLILYHDDNPAMTPKSVRKLIARVGQERFLDLLEVKRADSCGQNPAYSEEKDVYLKYLHDCYEEFLEQNNCFTIKDLAIDGKDLMVLGMKPGKQMGEMLKELLELVLDEPERNEKSYLERYVQERLSQLGNDD